MSQTQPVPASAGYGQFGAATTMATAGGGTPAQFGMQNGGYAATQQQAAWAGQAQYASQGQMNAFAGGAMPAQQPAGLGFGAAAMTGVAATQFAAKAGGMPPQGFPAPQQQQQQQQPQQFAGWAAQPMPAGNPFMVIMPSTQSF